MFIRYLCMANIRYRYIFDNISNEKTGKKIFDVELDEITLSFIPNLTEQNQTPDWVRLDFARCENCPLDPAFHEFCPIALNMRCLIESFKNDISYSPTLITVESEERIYQKNTTLQEGLNSIFGIIMATSNCPIMNFLKPMARFHLPFASMDETTYRSISTYLLVEYFRREENSDYEMNLDSLEKNYSNVQILNRGFSKRLFEITRGMGDAERNAVTLLNMFAQMISMEIKNNIAGLRALFTLPR